MEQSVNFALARVVMARSAYAGDDGVAPCELVARLADWYFCSMVDDWGHLAEDIGATWDASLDDGVPEWDALTPEQRGAYVGLYAAESARAAMRHLSEWDDVTGYAPEACEVWGCVRDA